MGVSAYALYVVAGLVFGMLGDFLLAMRFLSKKLHQAFFISGSVSFFLGHIVYIAAILTLCPEAWTYAIPIAIVALGAAGFYAYAKEVRAGKIMPLGVVYIAGVLFMTACAAAGAFIASSRALFLFFVGGICFSTSDNMLVVLSFGKNDSPYRNAVPFHRARDGRAELRNDLGAVQGRDRLLLYRDFPKLRPRRGGTRG